MDLAAALKYALSLHQAGRLAEAQALYDQILVAAPHHPDTLQLRGTVASLHPCPLTEKVCRPAPYVELSDNKTGQGRRLLVAGERDLDARHFSVGTEVTVTGRFATASADGMYFAPDGLILLDPLTPPADADATAAKPDAK